MSEKHKDGGTAFPMDAREFEGMSLRDWFAGQALAGICGHKTGFANLSALQAAEFAYQYADAMLEQREKQT